MQVINEFRGEYAFLSNFYEVPVEYKGLTYKNNEAAFQAQKESSRALEFINLPPNHAKSLGRKVAMRSDWDQVKVSIMHEIVLAKFMQNMALQSKLLATGNAKLIEGNNWNDYFWGVCNGKGRNELGKILEKVRSQLAK